MNVDFNIGWALKAGKDKFIRQHAKAYPDLDLNAEWDKISPPKVKSKDDK